MDIYGYILIRFNICIKVCFKLLQTFFIYLYRNTIYLIYEILFVKLMDPFGCLFCFLYSILACKFGAYLKLKIIRMNTVYYVKRIVIKFFRCESSNIVTIFIYYDWRKVYSN